MRETLFECAAYARKKKNGYWLSAIQGQTLEKNKRGKLLKYLTNKTKKNKSKITQSKEPCTDLTQCGAEDDRNSLTPM